MAEQSAYLHLPSGTVWPDPRDPLGIQHALRYGSGLTREQQLVAASILSAYGNLVLAPELTQKERNQRVSEIREATHHTDPSGEEGRDRG